MAQAFPFFELGMRISSSHQKRLKTRHFLDLAQRDFSHIEGTLLLSCSAATIVVKCSAQRQEQFLSAKNLLRSALRRSTDEPPRRQHDSDAAARQTRQICGKRVAKKSAIRTVIARSESLLRTLMRSASGVAHSTTSNGTRQCSGNGEVVTWLGRLSRTTTSS
jgi:hypothetical protein